jgi:hypothetical protein
MTRIRRSNVLLGCAFAFTAFVFAGCGPGVLKQPIHLEPGFQFTAVDEIVMLPAVDVRVDKSHKMDVVKDIGDRTKRTLGGRGYKVTPAGTTGDVGEIIDEDLRDAKPEWVRRLGPPSARWVLVVCLVDVKAKMTFGSTGNAELTAFLFDREAGTLVWRDKGVGQAGQGGLAGMLMKGSMAGSALDGAAWNLFASFPKRGKS